MTRAKCIGRWRAPPVVLPLLSAAVVAAAEPSKEAAAAPLRVAMSGIYWPLHAVAGGDHTGLEAELVEALAQELGRSVIYLDPKEIGPSTIECVASGKADMAINSITPTASRRQRVDFTRPYLELT